MGTSGREVNKAKQTLHLYGIANHHADTYYMSYRIKAGTTGDSSGETNTELHENVLPISLPLIRNSIFSDSNSQKCFSMTKTLLSERNKVGIRNFVPAVQRDTSVCNRIPPAG